MRIRTLSYALVQNKLVELFSAWNNHNVASFNILWYIVCHSPYLLAWCCAFRSMRTCSSDGNSPQMNWIVCLYIFSARMSEDMSLFLSVFSPPQIIRLDSADLQIVSKRGRALMKSTWHRSRKWLAGFPICLHCLLSLVSLAEAAAS